MNMKLSQSTLKKVEVIINESGMSKEDFIKNLASNYQLSLDKENYSQFLKDYNTYCDSFIG